MIVHLFTNNILLESAFLNIFKCLKWQHSSHQIDAIESYTFDTEGEHLILLSAPLTQSLVDTLERQSQKYPDLPIVLYLDTNISPFSCKLMDSIRAIIPMDGSEDQIKWILMLAADGHIILPADYYATTRHEDSEPEVLAASLTNRELEILQKITDGDANKEIARRLDISLNTVQVHASSIFRKLRVSNRTQAAHAFQLSKRFLEARQSMPSRTTAKPIGAHRSAAAAQKQPLQKPPLNSLFEKW